MDVFPTLTCCQRATPEEIESDPEAYSCPDCPFRLWMLRLGDENREALDLYFALAQPVVKTLRLTPVVFEAFGIRVGQRREIHDLLDRLAIIHEFVGAQAQADPMQAAVEEAIEAAEQE